MMASRLVPSLSGLLLALVWAVAIHVSLVPMHVGAQADGQEYFVQRGDSLYRIAQQFYGDGPLWPRIFEATNAKAQEDSSFRAIRNPSLLYVGQKLWIPILGSAEEEGAVEEGEVDRGEATEEIAVRIVSPENGATVPRQFEIVMAATGLIVEPAGAVRPGAGHMHLLIDAGFLTPGEVVPRDAQHIHYGQGELTATVQLEPGVHVLRLQFTNGAHIALDGAQYRDEITVTVSSELPSSPVNVRIVSPENGATVPHQFELQMAAEGLAVEPAGAVRPGAGHMHLLINTEFLAPGEVVPRDAQHIHYGQGELTATVQLEPGVHVLRLQFTNGAHIALGGEQYRDEITITVSSELPPPPTAVRIVSPVDGSTVPRQFELQMAAEGLEIEPAGAVRLGAGHMHLLIDVDFLAPGEVVPRDAQHIHYGQGELTATVQLEPGVHVLRLQFTNGVHIALNGEQYRDEVSVTVQE